MLNQMKQIQEMQKKFMEMQKKLQEIKIEKTNASHSLGVTLNGAQKLESVRIDASWFTLEKKEALQTSLCQLINEGFQEVQQKSAPQAAEMMKDFKGLNIPGL